MNNRKTVWKKALTIILIAALGLQNIAVYAANDDSGEAIEHWNPEEKDVFGNDIYREDSLEDNSGSDISDSENADDEEIDLYSGSAEKSGEDVKPGKDGIPEDEFDARIEDKDAFEVQTEELSEEELEESIEESDNNDEMLDDESGCEADDSEEEDKEPVYELNDGVLTVTGSGAIANNQYKNNTEITEIVINEGISSIGDYSFYGCANLKSVSFPNSLTAIGKYAFSKCTAMENVILNEGLSNIGARAFESCTELKEVYIPISVEEGSVSFSTGTGNKAYGIFNGCSNLITVNYAEGTTVIHEGLFAGSGLTELALPDSVTTIGRHAFSGCTALEDIVFPAGLTEIGEYAFSGCVSIQKVDLIEGISTIGKGAFKDNTLLTEVTIPLSVEGGSVAYSYNSSSYKAWGIFEGCSNLSTVNFAEGTTSIHSGLFAGSGLTRIDLPDSVTRIGSYAFANCTALEGIVFPESLTEIGEYAFSVCTSLQKVDLIEGITTIEKGAFKNDTQLTEVTIPLSVESGYVTYSYNNSNYYGYGIFDGCSSLSTVNFAEGTTNIHAGLFAGSGLTEISIPSQVTFIEDYSFANCASLKKVTFNDSIRSIGMCGFANCAALEITDLPEGLEKIGEAGFNSCSSITTLNLPETLITIGKKAFENCTSLSEVTLPSSITKANSYTYTYNSSSNMAWGIFNGCNKLETVHFPEGITYIPEALFAGSGLKSIELPETVTTIGPYAFSNTPLQSIDIPEGVNKMGYCAFSNCSSLQEVTMPINWSCYGFDNNTGLSAQGNLFYSCSKLSKINLPAGIDTITEYTFANCSGLSEIEIPETVTKIGEYAFCNCVSLTTAVLPEGITKLEEGVFKGCSKLETIEYSDSVDKIGAYAFSGCASLKEVSVPEGVSTIETGSFEGCVQLRRLELPSSVQKIDSKSFFSESAMEEIRFKGDAPEIAKNAFDNTQAAIVYNGNTNGWKGICDSFTNQSIVFVDAKQEYDRAIVLLLDRSWSMDGEPLTAMKQAAKEFSKVVLENSSMDTALIVFPYCGTGEAYGIGDDLDNYTNYIEAIECGDSTNIYGAFEAARRYLKPLNAKEKNIVLMSDGVPVMGVESQEGPYLESEFGDYYAFCNAIYSLVKEKIDPEYRIFTVGLFNALEGDELANAERFLKDIQDSGFCFANDIDELSAAFGKITEYVESEPIRGNFMSNKTLFTDDYGFRYKDSYFEQSATKYNQSLATMSLCLAFSAYGDEDAGYKHYDNNVKDLLRICGFCENESDPRCGYDTYHFNEKPTSDSIACAIGSKILPNGIPLIAVAVRGGGYEAEWASNFTLGINNDHDGFDKSAEIVLGYIKDYILKKGISGEIKIWIAGFSRGAAVATQTAARLDREGIENVSINKQSIFAYGFATPAGACEDSDPHSTDYNNIFNIICFKDPVPLVAPKQWGFDRYGITKILPDEELEKSSKVYVEKMKQFLSGMRGKYELGRILVQSNAIYFTVNNHRVSKIPIYTKEGIGVYNRKLIGAIVNYIKSREIFYLLLQSTMRDYGENTVGKKHAPEQLSSALLGLVGIILIDKKIADTIALNIMNNSSLFAVHADPRYYVAWMQSMDPNYSNSLSAKWSANYYRAVTVNCPVDVYVYDSNNELVASIVDEEPVEIEGSTIISTIDENESKVFYLPVDEEYEVKVVPREACEVTYSVNEFGTEYGNELRDVIYTGVKVAKGQELYGSTDAFSEEDLESESKEGSSVNYELKKDEDTITPALDLKGEEEISEYECEIAVSYDENQGTVYGAGKYVENSYVKLYAENKPGYDFEGFYVNGERLTDEDSDNTKYTVRIQVVDDLTVEARFIVCDHPEWEESITKEPTTTELGEKTLTCVVCGETKVEDIPKKDITLGKTTRGDMFNLANNVKVTWKEVPGAKYYKVYREGITDKKETREEPVIVTERLIGWDKEAGLTNGHAYRYKIVASLTGKGDPSGDSKLSYSKLMYRLKTVVIRSVKNTAPGKVTVKYDKTTSGDSYVLQYSDNKDMKNAKTKVVLGANNTSYTIGGLKKGKTYYISIRVRKKVNGIDYYTTFGVAKKVTITK